MKVYMNDMQREVLLYGAKDQVVAAGRGTGKGLLHAWRLKEVFQMMPRCTVGIVAAAAKRALANTLPSMLEHWERWGFRRDVHWCIGHKPPKKLGWPAPVIPPEDWSNVLSFYTGSIGVIVSQERTGTSNSKSFDYLDIDEAKFIDYELLKDETFQANRGQAQYFGDCHFHHGMLVTSDMPVTKKGSWFLNYEEKVDQELDQVIRGLIYERWRISDRLIREPGAPEYLKGELARINRQLNTLRKHAVFFKRYSSLSNLEILGPSFIRQLKRDLPRLTFMTSVLCMKIGTHYDGFYSCLRPWHKYKSTDFHYLDSFGYDFQAINAGNDCRMDADIQQSVPLCIAFDFNSLINWLVVGQPDRNRKRMNTLKSFYVKYDRRLNELCDDFDAYYRPRKARNNLVVFYYDSTALGSNYAVNKEDFKYVIMTRMRRNGWQVIPKYLGHPMNHSEKHDLINRGFAGQTELVPMFNEMNNVDLLISIETAGVYNGQKDKRGEKLAETEDDKLEGRTDGSDAWDTLYLGCLKKPVYGSIVPTT